MECIKSFKKHQDNCKCTYVDSEGKPCPRRGQCCACIAHHRKAGELPACYFTPEQEKTYDRSIDHYVRENYSQHKSFVNSEELPYLRKSIDKIKERHEKC